MIIQVYDDDMLNGEGLREVVFLQGCPHHCPGCFNPETWEFKEDTNETIDRSCKFFMHLEHKLNQDYIDGITISGGEPLAQQNLHETSELVRLANLLDKTVWIYTGYEWDYVKSIPFIDCIDVVCVGPFIEKLKSPEKPWVGSSNQQVIDVQKSLKENKIILWKKDTL